MSTLRTETPRVVSFENLSSFVDWRNMMCGQTVVLLDKFGESCAGVTLAR